jgi:phosphatidylserine/phosphatidylglycerophosphate/cardiolipin synthase-like enzyme
VLDVRTHTDGGQTAEAVAERVAAWVGAARRTLDLALYDVRLPDDVGERVAGAIKDAAARGVAVRIAFNQDERPADEEPGERPFFPAPPHTEPHVLETLGVPVKPIPGWRDLMHHKYVVRDGEAVWTGSMNWTLDSFTRQENVVATLGSPAVAAAFTRNFEQLWETLRVGDSGDFDSAPADGVRPWFCPGRGPELSHRIAKRIGAARRRVRIASPLLTAGPILGTLAEVVEEERVDVAGICDATQVEQVFRQWEDNPRSRWKGPLLTAGPILGTLAEVVEEERVDVAGICDATQVEQVFRQWEDNPRSRWKGPLLERSLVIFHGKRSTPYAPGAVHDYMHAKVTVADDTVFLGSFNLSRSGETNAENVLEIADAALADRLAAFVDELRARYPVVSPRG